MRPKKRQSAVSIVITAIHPSRRPASYEDDGKFYSFKTHLPKDIRLDRYRYSMWIVDSAFGDTR